MKRCRAVSWSVFFLVSIVGVNACFGQGQAPSNPAAGAIEKELDRLTGGHGKALADAAVPIHQRYQNSLSALLEQAIQADDSEAERKIVAALAALKFEYGSEPKQKPKPRTTDQLLEFLDRTVWDINHVGPDEKPLYSLVFFKDGTCLRSDGGTAVWSAQSSRQIEVGDSEPATLTENLTRFRAEEKGAILYGRLNTQITSLQEMLREVLEMRAIDISVPAAAEGKPPRRTVGEIIVNVDKGGKIKVEGKARTEAELLMDLREIATDYKDQAVILRGDRETGFDDIVSVLNICQKAGIWNVAFATARPEKD